MTTTTLFEDRFRRWDQLTKEQQEEILRDDEHRNEDHARYRWKWSSVGPTGTWDKEWIGE